MIKIITLFKRRAGMAVEDFQHRWLHEHGPLAAGMPGMRRYVQSHTLPQGYRKGELPYDGISEMWFDSIETWHASRETPGAQAIAADQADFTDAGRTVVMPVDVLVMKDGAIPDNAVKNIEFVNQRAGMDRDAFRAHWRDIHGPIASRIEVIRRYEQNPLQLSEYAAGAMPRYDGLAITWFDSTAAMKQGATTEAYAVTRADEPNFLPDGHLPIIVTREFVLAG